MGSPSSNCSSWRGDTAAGRGQTSKVAVAKAPVKLNDSLENIQGQKLTVMKVTKKPHHSYAGRDRKKIKDRKEKKVTMQKGHLRKNLRLINKCV